MFVVKRCFDYLRPFLQEIEDARDITRVENPFGSSISIISATSFGVSNPLCSSVSVEKNSGAGAGKKTSNDDREATGRVNDSVRQRHQVSDENIGQCVSLKILERIIH